MSADSPSPAVTCPTCQGLREQIGLADANEAFAYAQGRIGEALSALRHADALRADLAACHGTTPEEDAG